MNVSNNSTGDFDGFEASSPPARELAMSPITEISSSLPTPAINEDNTENDAKFEEPVQQTSVLLEANATINAKVNEPSSSASVSNETAPNSTLDSDAVNIPSVKIEEPEVEILEEDSCSAEQDGFFEMPSPNAASFAVEVANQVRVGDVFTDSEDEAAGRSMIQTARKNVMAGNKHLLASLRPKHSLDLEAMAAPFAQGWKREVVFRSAKSETERRTAADVYYFTPSNKKLRSIVQVEKYLSENENTSLSGNNFSFGRHPLGMDPSVERIKRKFDQVSEDSLQGEKPAVSSVPLKKRKVDFHPNASYPTEETCSPRHFLDIAGAPSAAVSEPSQSVPADPTHHKTKAPSAAPAAPAALAAPAAPGSDGTLISRDCEVIMQRMNPGVTRAQYPLYDAGSEAASSWNQSLCRIGRPLRLGNTPASHVVEPPLCAMAWHGEHRAVKGSEAEKTYHCTAHCPGVHGALPSLPCVKCRCLFHPQCIHLPYSLTQLITSLTYKLMCPNCYLETKRSSVNVKVPPNPVTPYEPLSYEDDPTTSSYSDYSDPDEGVGSDLENLDPTNSSLLGVDLRPPTPTTPDYSLESYFPPAGTTIQQQRNMALEALQNLGSADSSRRAPAPARPAAPSRQPQQQTNAAGNLGTPSYTLLPKSSTSLHQPKTFQRNSQPQHLLLSAMQQSSMQQSSLVPLHDQYMQSQEHMLAQAEYQQQQNIPGFLQNVMTSYQMLEKMKVPEPPVTIPTEPVPSFKNYARDVSLGYGVMKLVLARLPPLDLLRAAQTCVMWRDLALGPDMWAGVRLTHLTCRVKSWRSLAVFLDARRCRSLAVTGPLMSVSQTQVVEKNSKKITQAPGLEAHPPVMNMVAHEGDPAGRTPSNADVGSTSPASLRDSGASPTVVSDQDDDDDEPMEIDQDSVTPGAATEAYDRDGQDEAERDRRRLDTVLQDLESPSKDDSTSESEELDVTADFPTSSDGLSASVLLARSENEVTDISSTNIQKVMGDKSDDVSSKDTQEAIVKETPAKSLEEIQETIDKETPAKLLEDAQEIIDKETPAKSLEEMQETIDKETPAKSLEEMQETIDKETPAKLLEDAQEIIDKETPAKSLEEMQETIDKETPAKSLEEMQETIDKETPAKSLEEIQETIDNETHAKFLERIQETVDKKTSAKSLEEIQETIDKETPAKSLEEIQETIDKETHAKFLEEIQETVGKKTSAKSLEETQEDIDQETPAKSLEDAQETVDKETTAKASKDTLETNDEVIPAKSLESTQRTFEEEMPADSRSNKDIDEETPVESPEDKQGTLAADTTEKVSETEDSVKISPLSDLAEEKIEEEVKTVASTMCEISNGATGNAEAPESRTIDNEMTNIKGFPLVSVIPINPSALVDLEFLEKSPEGKRSIAAKERMAELVSQDLSGNESGDALQGPLVSSQEDEAMDVEESFPIDKYIGAVFPNKEPIEMPESSSEVDVQAANIDYVMMDLDSSVEDFKEVLNPSSIGDVSDGCRTKEKDGENITRGAYPDVFEVTNEEEHHSTEVFAPDPTLLSSNGGSPKDFKKEDKSLTTNEEVEVSDKKSLTFAENSATSISARHGENEVSASCALSQAEAKAVEMLVSCAVISSEIGCHKESSGSNAMGPSIVKGEAYSSESSADALLDEKAKPDISILHDSTTKLATSDDPTMPPKEESRDVQLGSMDIDELHPPCESSEMERLSQVHQKTTALLKVERQSQSPELEVLSTFSSLHAAQEITSSVKIDVVEEPAVNAITDRTEEVKGELAELPSSNDDVSEEQSNVDMKQLSSTMGSQNPILVPDSPVAVDIGTYHAEVSHVNNKADVFAAGTKVETSAESAPSDTSPRNTFKSPKMSGGHLAGDVTIELTDQSEDESSSSQDDLTILPDKTSAVDQVNSSGQRNEDEVSSESEIEIEPERHMKVEQHGNIRSESQMDVDDLEDVGTRSGKFNEIPVEEIESETELGMSNELREEEEDVEGEDAADEERPLTSVWEEACRSVGLMQHLRKLQLTECGEDLLEHLLPHCSRLTALHISKLGDKHSNLLLRLDPNLLLNAVALEDLHLSGHFTFTSNFNFIKLRKLKKLGLVGAQLPLWPHLGTSLTHLYLSPVSRFTSDTWNNIAAMNSLVELSLGEFSEGVSDSSWHVSLSRLTQLRKLALTDCALGPRLLVLLKKFSALQKVVLKPLSQHPTLSLPDQLWRVKHVWTLLPTSLRLLCDVHDLTVAPAPNDPTPRQGLVFAISGSKSTDQDGRQSSSLQHVALDKLPRFFSRRSSARSAVFTFRVLAEGETPVFPEYFCG
ncbi:hypothetical protein HAZT_HAZT010038 [Hyalella azteca]|uniref:MBD domain-containing protein n=1 Tax=Hyalella azteca TaxID=294128 RepID=A0A6A0GU83_HYAAZ|nr:hypothetical protein HAZT_HAZT010038 [Hyalella azteca]